MDHGCDMLYNMWRVSEWVSEWTVLCRAVFFDKDDDDSFFQPTRWPSIAVDPLLVVLPLCELGRPARAKCRRMADEADESSSLNGLGERSPVLLHKLAYFIWPSRLDECVIRGKRLHK